MPTHAPPPTDKLGHCGGRLAMWYHPESKTLMDGTLLMKVYTVPKQFISPYKPFGVFADTSKYPRKNRCLLNQSTRHTPVQSVTLLGGIRSHLMTFQNCVVVAECEKMRG